MTTDPAPLATYRLQLTPEQDLDAAAGLVPYLAQLGVSHVYLSPIFEAVPGSTHGYDGTDPTRVREELGGRPALHRLRAVLDEHEMGLLLDVVPNHLAADAHGPWWRSLLAEGPEGEGARTFDVDWSGGPSRPPGTVLLPVLGKPLDEVLAAGELVVSTGDRGPELRYYEHRFPLRADTDLDADLDEVLAAQPYRLVHWKVAADELGYRRFFDITGLVGVRVEDPAVFERALELAIDLCRDGTVQGLRLDHVDGLADPEGLLDRLADRAGRPWTVVEKILGHDEQLRSEWAVDGTTGYEAGALIGAVLADPTGVETLLDLHRRTTGESRSWDEVVQEAKVEVLERLFRPERDRLVRLLSEALAAAHSDAVVDDLLEPGVLESALNALLVSFDVYRIYPPPSGPLGVEDAFRLRAATERARLAASDHVAVLDRVEALLLAGAGGPAGLELRSRLAQLTGPVMAKGVEDTALYRWVPFVGTGDVGAEPWPVGCSLSAFHERAAAMTARPQGLVSTSTHDSKRSADVRARLLLLSEVADEWAEVVERWQGDVEEDVFGQRRPADLGDPATSVDGRTRLLLLQTLVGAWPIDEERVQAYMQKAGREAKQHTSWTEPKLDHEQAVERFVSAAFADRRRLADVEAMAARLTQPGRVVSLATTLLHLTLPGVPDLYQGNEVWRLDLTDPDDRRPVSWDRRRVLLRTAADAEVGDVWPEQVEGLPKLWLVHRVLVARRDHARSFAGGYAPVLAVGEGADHVVALRRGDDVVAVAPRHPLRLEQEGGWRDTTIVLPEGRWTNLLGEPLTWQGEVSVAELLDAFPVALLVRTSSASG